MTTRKAINKKLRFEVFKRDAFTCAYCGSSPPNVVLQVDHIKPVSLGGLNDIGNLVTSCAPCNLGKSNRALNSIPASLEVSAAQVKEREAQIAAFAESMLAAKQRREKDAWKVADVLMSAFSSDSIRKDWFRSIENFIDRIGVVATVDAMEIATCRKYSKIGAFRYFCGICWNKSRDAA